jgi:hypothetical protein
LIYTVQRTTNISEIMSGGGVVSLSYVIEKTGVVSEKERRALGVQQRA